MTLRGSLALVAATATALSGLVGILYGARDGLVTWALLAPPGAAALLVAHLAAARRRRLGSLERQFALTALLTAGQVLIVVGAGAAVMFVSTHDAVLALVIVLLAATVALRTAQLLAHGVLADIRGLRDTLVAVGDGSREPVGLAPSRDELGELARAADATIERLAGTERARRDLIAAVSHDLRTPITSLRLLAEAVQDGVVEGETRAGYLRQMRGHVMALSALIDDLFELSRLEAGDMEWGLQQVRLAALVSDSVEAMQAQADAHMVRLRARASVGADADAAAHANPERLQRVLFNLIQNAIRHTPADGSVTVLTEAAGDRVEVEVADTGPGIPAADRARVFEPFYRGGEDTARTSDGAGLGLAIARAIVEAHGGRIWLADAAQGTRVRFSIPRTAT